MNENGKKLIGTLAFVIWSTIVLSGFYIIQRPLFLQLVSGTTATLWSIVLAAILLIDSAGLGYLTLKKIHLQLLSHERFIFGTGLGLGMLGFIGYGLGATGLSSVPILATIIFFILICTFTLKINWDIYNDIMSLINSLQKNQDGIPRWVPLAVLYTELLGFFFALLPPAEGFDGLSYHLKLPEQLLKDGRILPYNILQFWFPSLVEGDFLWALGLKSERTAQLIHWSFSILVIALIWEWSRQVFGHKPAWWALAVLISMPSLTWLSAWAYTDMALTFFGMACIYGLWRWSEKNEGQWLIVSGVFSGLAMGVKYTSFILPLLCVIFILFNCRNIWKSITSSLTFSFSALLTASPWYLRNWFWVGNPIYPFVFGGRYWDPFQSTMLNGFGSGIGWNVREILLLPFTLTFGYRDQNYFDGRLGPLFLLLLPVTLWTVWKNKSAPARERRALYIINIFALLSYIFWTLSVTQTIHLWQSRLLFPGLIPYTISIGVGVAYLDKLNFPRLRISFVATTLIGLVIAITLLDNSLSLIARRPIDYALGMETRQHYFERIQPTYSEALKLVNTTPPQAYIYFIFEPRSYNMTRKVEPDVINDNLAHDYYLFHTTKAIIRDWKSKGYTHILVYKPGISFFTATDGGVSEVQLTNILKNLKVDSNMENYVIYSIP